MTPTEALVEALRDIALACDGFAGEVAHTALAGWARAEAARIAAETGHAIGTETT